MASFWWVSPLGSCFCWCFRNFSLTWAGSWGARNRFWSNVYVVNCLWGYHPPYRDDIVYGRSLSHCFFTIMNTPKKGNFQFCFPGLLGIHSESFLKKVSVRRSYFDWPKSWTSFEALWKCHIQKIFITFSRVHQIQDLGQSKYKLRLSSKRTHWISKILFN